MIRDVNEIAPKDALCREVVENRSLFQNSSTQEFFRDSRLVATLAQDEAIGPLRSIAMTYFCGKLGIFTSACIALVCFGDTQKARQITWPDYEEQEDDDDAPIHEVVQALPPLHKPPHAESRRRLRAEPPNKAKAKPKQKNTSTVAR